MLMTLGLLTVGVLIFGALVAAVHGCGRILGE